MVGTFSKEIEFEVEDVNNYMSFNISRSHSTMKHAAAMFTVTLSSSQTFIYNELYLQLQSTTVLPVW
jgi:hypothetical protein